MSRREYSAGGIVYRKHKGKIEWLVTQHSQHKGWGFPKGLIGDKEKNEGVPAAALREVREEGGVDAKIVNDKTADVQYFYKYKGETVDKKVSYYLMEYTSGDPADHDWEVSEAKFLPEAEVKTILTFKSDKEAFEKILVLYGASTGSSRP